MLWSKESNKADALYVDMFALKGKRALNQFHSQLETECQERGHSTCVKSGAKALERRNEGNKLFGKCQWSQAMELYNESLCYAEPGSEHISLAYANRSACFIRMKMYRECLIDIDLAKRFGFPTEKMRKLDERKAECLRYIDGVEETNSRIKMNYEPDDKFPCMANVLKLERNADGTHSVIAKEDIDVGKTIAVDKAFSSSIYMCFGWRCNICLKSIANLVPCPKCTVAMFCYGSCETNPIHKYECGLTFMGKSQTDGLMMNLARIIFKLIHIFSSSADELMNFVESVINIDRNDLPSGLINDKSKYGAFLKLPFLWKLFETEYFMAVIHSVYKKLLDIPKVADMFKTLNHRRFLMHLITQHALITDHNSIRIRYLGISFNNEDNIMCSHQGLITGYFGHSCAPNVFWGDCDGHHVYITIRPVKKGDPLHTFYFDILMEPKLKRQQKLYSEKEILCKCKRCEGEAISQAQWTRLSTSPEYLQIVLNGYNGDPTIGIEKCETFLRMCGQVPWCDEIGRVTSIYMDFLRERLMGTLNLNTILERVAKDIIKGIK